MVVGPARLELVPLVDQTLCEGAGVVDDGLGVGLEARVGRLLERDGDAGDRVVVGAALAGGEDGVVDARLEVGLLVLPEEDQAGSGPAERLVRGGGDHVAVGERVVLGLAGDQARDVGHLGVTMSGMDRERWKT